MNSHNVKRYLLLAIELSVMVLGTTPSWAASAPDAVRLYVSYCANCHGRWGKGDGPSAVVLNTKPDANEQTLR